MSQISSFLNLNLNFLNPSHSRHIANVNTEDSYVLPLKDLLSKTSIQESSNVLQNQERPSHKPQYNQYVPQIKQFLSENSDDDPVDSGNDESEQNNIEQSIYSSQHQSVYTNYAQINEFPFAEIRKNGEVAQRIPNNLVNQISRKQEEIFQDDKLDKFQRKLNNLQNTSQIQRILDQSGISRGNGGTLNARMSAQTNNIQINSISSVGSSMLSSREQPPISNRFMQDKMIDIQMKGPESISHRDIMIDPEALTMKRPNTLVDPEFNTFRSQSCAQYKVMEPIKASGNYVKQVEIQPQKQKDYLEEEIMSSEQNSSLNFQEMEFKDVYKNQNELENNLIGGENSPIPTKVQINDQNENSFYSIDENLNMIKVEMAKSLKDNSSNNNNKGSSQSVDFYSFHPTLNKNASSQIEEKKDYKILSKYNTAESHQNPISSKQEIIEDKEEEDDDKQLEEQIQKLIRSKFKQQQQEQQSDETPSSRINVKANQKEQSETLQSLESQTQKLNKNEYRVVEEKQKVKEIKDSKIVILEQVEVDFKANGQQESQRKQSQNDFQFQQIANKEPRSRKGSQIQEQIIKENAVQKNEIIIQEQVKQEILEQKGQQNVEAIHKQVRPSNQQKQFHGYQAQNPINQVRKDSFLHEIIIEDNNESKDKYNQSSQRQPSTKKQSSTLQTPILPLSKQSQKQLQSSSQNIEKKQQSPKNKLKETVRLTQQSSPVINIDPQFSTSRRGSRNFEDSEQVDWRNQDYPVFQEKYGKVEKKSTFGQRKEEKQWLEKYGGLSQDIEMIENSSANKKAKRKQLFQSSNENSPEREQKMGRMLSGDSVKIPSPSNKTMNKSSQQQPNYELYDEIYKTLVESKESNRQIKEKVTEFFKTPLYIYKILVQGNKQEEKKDQEPVLPKVKKTRQSKERKTEQVTAISRTMSIGSLISRKTQAAVAKSEEHVIFQSLCYTYQPNTYKKFSQICLAITQNYIMVYSPSDSLTIKTAKPLIQVLRFNISKVNRQQQEERKGYVCKQFQKLEKNKVVIELKQEIDLKKEVAKPEINVVQEKLVSGFLLEGMSNMKQEKIFKQDSIKDITVVFDNENELKSLIQIIKL